MNIHLNFFADLTIVFVAIVISLTKWKQLEAYAKIFFMTMVWYFFAQLVTEGGLLYDIRSRFGAFYYSVRGLQTIVEFILCVLFFHFGIEKFRERRIAFYAIPAAIVLWLVSIFAFRKTENFNVYYAPVACFASIILAIAAIYYMQAQHDVRELVKLPVFRFSVLLLFFYGFFFIFLVTYPLVLQNRKAELFAVYFVFRLTNIYYIAASLVYLFYPKRALRIE